jgi:hypothetical protein
MGAESYLLYWLSFEAFTVVIFQVEVFSQNMEAA